MAFTQKLLSFVFDMANGGFFVPLLRLGSIRRGGSAATRPTPGISA
jgi:hypothetical protein